MHSRLNNDTLNALSKTNKFYKKEKLLGNEKDLPKQKLSSKPAKAAETTETVEAGFKKDLERPRHLIILRLKCRGVCKMHSRQSRYKVGKVCSNLWSLFLLVWGKLRQSRDLFFQIITRQSRQSRDLLFQLLMRQSRQSRNLFFLLLTKAK